MATIELNVRNMKNRWDLMASFILLSECCRAGCFTASRHRVVLRVAFGRQAHAGKARPRPDSRSPDSRAVSNPLAPIARISRGRAYSLAAEGKLPVIRLGRRMVVPKAALQKMLDEAGNGGPNTNG